MTLSETALEAAHKAYHGSAPDDMPNPHLRAAILVYLQAASGEKRQCDALGTDPLKSRFDLLRGAQLDELGLRLALRRVLVSGGYGVETDSVFRTRLWAVIQRIKKIEGDPCGAIIAQIVNSVAGASAPAPKRTVWVNLYGDGQWGFYETQEGARKFAGPCQEFRLLATAVPVEIEG